MNDFDDIEILLAEDNALDAEMTMRALKKCTTLDHVYWVKDGVEALQFVRGEAAFAGRNPASRLRLLLLDLKMPRLDGMDVLRELKRDPKTNTLPIVMMSASDQEDDIQESLRLGVDGYVMKPVRPDEFRDTVAAIGMFWLRGKRIEVVIDFENVEILLVEDSREDAELTMRALTKNSFRNKLHWVQDGVDALDFIRCSGAYKDRDARQRPKLVLLDLKMPRLGGLDVVRAMKADDATRQIPIVIMTSSNHSRDIIESYQLGANGYVTKPIQFEDLAAAVTKIANYWLRVNQVP